LVINKKSVPSSSYNKDDVVEKVSIIDLFMDSGLCKSKSDARRLIQQGGAYINGDRVASFDQIIISEDIKEDEILLRAGKKKYHKIILI
jgi:tyrosyl-tRNA synthetase